MPRWDEDRERVTEQVTFRLSGSDARRLDRIALQGGYTSRPQLVRSMVLAILNDDAKTHGETAA